LALAKKQFEMKNERGVGKNEGKPSLLFCAISATPFMNLVNSTTVYLTVLEKLQLS